MNPPLSWLAAWVALGLFAALDAGMAPQRRTRAMPWSAAMLAAALAALAALYASGGSLVARPGLCLSVTTAVLAWAAVAGPLLPRPGRVAGSLLVALMAILARILPALAGPAAALRAPVFGLSAALAAGAAGLALHASLMAAFTRDSGRGVRTALNLALLLQALSAAIQMAGAARFWAAPWFLDPLSCWRLLGALLLAGLAVLLSQWPWPSRVAGWAISGIAVLLGLILVGALPLLQWLALPQHYWISRPW